MITLKLSYLPTSLFFSLRSTYESRFLSSFKGVYTHN